jgi:AraC-like DNA-binding protein
MYEAAEVACVQQVLLPTVSVALVVNLSRNGMAVYDRHDTVRSDGLSGCAVFGPLTEYCYIVPRGDAALLGVQFKPGGAFPFFGFPVAELENQRLPLDAVWGPQAAELRDRIIAAPTPAAKMEVVERFLLARIQPGTEAHPGLLFALGCMARLPYTGGISRIIDRSGYSHRRINQLFRREIGVLPKAYSRIRRFQDILRLAHHDTALPMAEIALNHGYYDQAHFIHDIRDFSGLSPSELFRCCRRLNALQAAVCDALQARPDRSKETGPIRTRRHIAGKPTDAG